MREGRAAAAHARRPRRRARAFPRPAARGRALTLRGIALALALIACVGSGWLAARAADWYAETDLFCLWHGAHLTLRGEDPYDDATWHASTLERRAELGTAAGASCPGAYGYPLWTAVVMAPFGALPLPIGATAWMAVSFAAAASGVALIWLAVGGGRGPGLLFAALVLASQPFWILVISGQITGVLLGLAGLGAWLLQRGRDRAATAAFAALLLKPQVGIVALLVVGERILARRPTAAIGAIATLALLLTVSLAVRPTWLADWGSELSGRRLRSLEFYPTAWGLSADMLGTASWAPLLIAGALSLIIALTRPRPPGPVTVAALALSLSLFAVPYVWSYDFLVLALPLGVAIGLAEHLPRPRRMIVLALCVVAGSLLPWSLYAVAFTRGQETFSAVVPVAAALVVAVAVALQPQRTGALV